MPEQKNPVPVKTDEQTTAVATRDPSPAMLALFGTSGSLKVAVNKSDRKTLPMMIKPKYCPIGGVLQGKIVKSIDSPVTTIKGKLLWLELDGGREVLFPCTGVIRTALAPDVEAESKKELQTALDKHIGKILTLERLPNGQTKKGAEEGQTRDMYLFDVYLTEAPKK